MSVSKERAEELIRITLNELYPRSVVHVDWINRKQHYEVTFFNRSSSGINYRLDLDLGYLPDISENDFKEYVKRAMLDTLFDDWADGEEIFLNTPALRP